jgi:hypothetical protein
MAALSVLLGGSFLGVTTHGTAPASFCIKGATPLPDADGWPKNPKPDAWVKVRAAPAAGAAHKRTRRCAA